MQTGQVEKEKEHIRYNLIIPMLYYLFTMYYVCVFLVLYPG
mgnify:CR=1 FL=1